MLPKEVEKYIRHTYSGTELMKKHSLAEPGIWEVRGEGDSASSFNVRPRLLVVQGVLQDVIQHSVKLKDFYTYGGGGDFTKLDIKSIGELINMAEVQARREALKAELDLLDEQIRRAAGSNV